MTGPTYTNGERVTVTAEGPLGVLDPDANRPAFHPSIVLVRGDQATYIGPGPSDAGEDWHFVEVERDGALYLAPVHVAMIEPAP